MKPVSRHSSNELRQIITYALLILPAVCLGVLAMMLGGVSPALWGQQAAAWLALALLAGPLRQVIRRISFPARSMLLLIPLIASLLGGEMEGVRRWLNLGVFNVNAAMLVLPALLVVLCSQKCPYPVLLGASVVLCVQPDLSQLTAFSVAVLPLLWNRRRERMWTVMSVLLLTVLVIRCILVPVSVQPVECCEGILTMLGETSLLLQVSGVIVLAAIPIFWGYQFFLLRKLHVLCFSVYYAVTMMFILTGDYPVPFMGFGLSPIAGYYLAYIFDAAHTNKDKQSFI